MDYTALYPRRKEGLFKLMSGWVEVANMWNITEPQNSSFYLIFQSVNQGNVVA
jgi:hypothetical protein